MTSYGPSLYYFCVHLGQLGFDGFVHISRSQHTLESFFALSQEYYVILLRFAVCEWLVTYPQSSIFHDFCFIVNESVLLVHVTELCLNKIGIKNAKTFY